MIFVTACNTRSGMFIYNEINDELKQLNEIESRGCCLDEFNNIFVASHYDQCIYKLNSNFEIIHQTNKLDYNIHSLTMYNNSIYAMNTYDDTLYIYNPKTLELVNTIYFKNEKTKENFYHINDLYIIHDTIFMTMFRDQHFMGVNDLEYKTLKNVGKMKSLKLYSDYTKLGNTLIDNLTQPHTPFLYKDYYMCCDSRKNKVIIKSFSDPIFLQVIKTKGFTRGLEIINDILYVGVSTSIKRPTSKINTEDINLEIENSLIEIFDFNNFTKIKEIEIPSDEIYSLKYLNNN